MRTITTVLLVVTLLVAAGCGQKNESATDKGQTAKPPSISIHAAALEGNVDAIRKHVEAGSDLNKKDAFGSTALIIAATFGKTEVAAALIDGGADLDMKNHEGATPLHVAAFLCRTEIVRALLDKGADKTLRDKVGSTALESVAGPFDQVKSYYDGIEAALKPFGLKLDHERIEQTRPAIAEMLQ